MDSNFEKIESTCLSEFCDIKDILQRNVNSDLK